MGAIVTRFFCSVIPMPASLTAEQTLAPWLSHQHALGGLRPLLRPLHTVVGFCHSFPYFRCLSTPASFQNNHRACIYLLLRVKLTQSSAADTGTDLCNQAFLWVPCEKPAGVGLESHEAISKPALLQPSEDLRAVLSGHLKKPCQVDSKPLTRASNILRCRKRIPLPFNPLQQSEKHLKL